MKKGILLTLIVLLLVAGWFGGWFFVADKVETTLSDTKTKLAEDGKSLECANQELSGFPFRVGVRCETFSYTDEESGVSLEMGELKTAAQAYQPNKAVMEMASPANLTLPNGDRFNTSWKSMRSSLTAGLSGPEKFSLQGSDVVIVPLKKTRQTALIGDLQLHGRQVEDNDVNIAVTLQNAKSQNAIWPGFDLQATILLEDSYSDLLGRTDIIRLAKSKGLSGEIENFVYRPSEGGMLKVSGPAQIDTQGLLSGKFEVSVNELPQLLRSLGKTFPKDEKKFRDASKAATLLAKRSGNGEITIPVDVRNGQVNIGLIPVGKLAPLF